MYLVKIAIRCANVLLSRVASKRMSSPRSSFTGVLLDNHTRWRSEEQAFRPNGCVSHPVYIFPSVIDASHVEPLKYSCTYHEKADRMTKSGIRGNVAGMEGFVEKPKRIVFYSWQSDLDGKTTRSFIEEALKKAIKVLQKDDTLDVGLVIDRDTKDVPGSPDIAKTILEKIDRAQMFVGDVTIVNQGAPRLTPIGVKLRKGKEKLKAGRKGDDKASLV